MIHLTLRIMLYNYDLLDKLIYKSVSCMPTYNTDKLKLINYLQLHHKSGIKGLCAVKKTVSRNSNDDLVETLYKC